MTLPSPSQLFAAVAFATGLLPSRPLAAPIPPRTFAPDTLSAIERAIARAVDDHNAEALSLLERIVNINSGTMNLAGVRQVGDVLRAEFDALGFATRWVDGSGFRRAGHLIAEHPGPGPRILLIGHLDTVFEPSHPFQRFERLNDSTARGPGIIDMKGGDVIVLHALKALKAAGALDRLNLIVVFNGDEEESGSPQDSARAALITAAAGARYALGFEDGSGDPHTALVARRGVMGWTVRSTGTPAHSSQIFRSDVGDGAIFESARLLDQIRLKLSGQQYLTFNPGIALGGTRVETDTTGTVGSAEGKTNVVARTMEVSGDIRAISPEQLRAAQAEMRRIVAEHLPGTSSELIFHEGYPPLAPTAANRALLASYDAISQALGYGAVTAVDPARAGAADISFVASSVQAAIDGIGLAGANDHTDQETADLRMLAPLTKRAAILLYRIGTPVRASTR
jgi:glutamate carboxypeptidase